LLRGRVGATGGPGEKRRTPERANCLTAPARHGEGEFLINVRRRAMPVADSTTETAGQALRFGAAGFAILGIVVAALGVMRWQSGGDRLPAPIWWGIGFGIAIPLAASLLPGAVVAALLYLLVARTRIGMLVRAGASNREMALAMGVNIRWLFTLLFGVGAGLCAVAGALLGPLLAVQVGMGENILILAFVVIVIGGIGSIRGALVGSLVVGIADTIGRAFLPILFGLFFQPRVASAAGPAIASVLVYLLMAVVLYFKPQGLFPARG